MASSRQSKSVMPMACAKLHPPASMTIPNVKHGQVKVRGGRMSDSYLDQSDAYLFVRFAVAFCILQENAMQSKFQSNVSSS